MLTVFWTLLTCWFVVAFTVTLAILTIHLDSDLPCMTIQRKSQQYVVCFLHTSTDILRWRYVVRSNCVTAIIATIEIALLGTERLAMQ